MRIRLIAGIPVVFFLSSFFFVSCGKGQEIVTQGNHDIPDAWQMECLSRADMMADVQWTPLYRIPKTYNKLKDVWWAPGATYKGLPYSASGTEMGFVGRDVSFYTFLSAVHNPRSSIYTVDYRQAPWNRDKASTFYGAVCSSAVCFALGIPTVYNTGPINSGKVASLLEDIGTRASDIRLCDALCYMSEDGESGHVVMAYDIVRSKSGSISKITIFECAGPITRRYTQTEEQLRSWLERTGAHIYRLREEKRNLRPGAFMETSLSGMPPFPESICLEDGDRKSYPEGKAVRINVFADSGTVELYKDGALYATASVSETVEFGGLPAGLYTAKLAGGSDATLFQIAGARCRVRRTGDGLAIDSFEEGLVPLYCTMNDAAGGLPTLLEEGPGGVWYVEKTTSATTHCRVYYAGRYGIVKGDSIAVQ